MVTTQELFLKKLNFFDCIQIDRSFLAVISGAESGGYGAKHRSYHLDISGIQHHRKFQISTISLRLFVLKYDAISVTATNPTSGQ